MKMRVCIVSLALLCCCAMPSLAGVDLFGFSASNIQNTFDGASQFSTNDWAWSVVNVYRNTAPIGSAVFVPMLWGSGSEAFVIDTTISNITATTADSQGTFNIWDTDGDVIDGSLNGVWTKSGSGGHFSGVLTNVSFTSVVDNAFDGHSGSVSMVFGAPLPWEGSIISMTTDGGWFQGGAFDITGGSVDAMVGAQPVPAPGAFLLTLLGAMAVRSRRTLAQAP
jgi:hypothetical protein